MERLQKIIAASGLASRRQAEKFIIAGEVAVNGKIVRELGSSADPATDRITVGGKLVSKPTSITYLLYKPKGVVSSTRKQAKEKIVTELVPKVPPVYPVGRLDKDSEGLLLLSNDGEITHKLTHPSHTHPKVYEVRTRWQSKAPLPPEKVTHLLRKGVKLGDGVAKADTVVIKQGASDELILIITIHEGRHHLIRRMCATIGLDVTRLKRTKLAHLSLGSLRPGQYRVVTARELSSLS